MKIAALLSLAFASCPAQSPDPAPRFEVASVKLSNLGESSPGAPFQMTHGSFNAQALPLRAALMLAYKVQMDQITGPDWMGAVRMDVTARAAGPADDDQVRLMLRTLLAERFGVKAHMDRKEMPVYVLELAKGGPKFSRSAEDGQLKIGQQNGVLTLQHISIVEFALSLQGKPFDRPVIDRTGLEGRYDIRIDARDMMASSQGGQMEAMNAMMVIFQQQLGLKVEARKDFVDVLVVDHAEKTPTAN